MTIHPFVFNPFMELTYIVHDEACNAVIIDCGCCLENEQRIMQRYIDRNQLRPIGLLNTHFHLDHQFGNAYIYDNYGLLPYCSEADRKLLDSVDTQCEWFGIKPMSRTLRDFIPVADGQVLRFGDMQFRVIATPGHTPGGVCYLLTGDNDPDILFSGDTLFAGSIGRTDLPYSDYQTLIDSIHTKLSVLKDDTVIYPGHGPKSTIAAEKRSNPFL